MEQYTTVDLQESINALKSTLSKCEKVLLKLKDGAPQHTLTIRRIKALRIAVLLMEEKLQQNGGNL
jgi:hypothetical protein